MRNTFAVTYEVVTPESAEHGDAEERGFVVKDVGFREAFEELQGLGCHVEHNGTLDWLTAYEVNDGTREYYETGAVESRSLHFPDSITSASRVRVARLLDCYGV